MFWPVLAILRQPEDGQYGPKHVVVHLAIKYAYVTELCLTIYNFQEFSWVLEPIILLLNGMWGFPEGYSSQGMKGEFTDICVKSIPHAFNIPPGPNL